jgi:hypothetical protein
MKTWLKNGLEMLAVVLLLPQVFLLLYFFRYLFLGQNVLGLAKTLCVYGLTISWVSAPVLVLLAAGVKALLRARARWYVTLLACWAAGTAWVAAWNLLVYPVFSYAWAALPVLLCSVGFAGYAGARVLYLESLLPEPPPQAPPEPAGPLPDAAKNGGPDLSE